MPTEAVIFDLDGTLLDTVADIAGAANQALADKGLDTHDVEAYRGFVGHGSLELMSRAGGRPTSDPLVIELEAAFQAAYEFHWNRRTHPYPGIDDLLSRLAEQQIPMAVLSNKPHRSTVKCVSHHLPNQPLDPVLGQRPDVPKKPDPIAALEIAQAWQRDVAGIAFVGDTTVDLETARRAGMRPIGVTWGFHDRSELEPFRMPLADTTGELWQLLGFDARD